MSELTKTDAFNTIISESYRTTDNRQDAINKAFDSIISQYTGKMRGSILEELSRIGINHLLTTFQHQTNNSLLNTKKNSETLVPTGQTGKVKSNLPRYNLKAISGDPLTGVMGMSFSVSDNRKKFVADWTRKDLEYHLETRIRPNLESYRIQNQFWTQILEGMPDDVSTIRETYSSDYLETIAVDTGFKNNPT